MQGKFCVQRTDLLTVAVGCDRYDAVCVAKLWRFQQCERRNALASGKLKNIYNEGIILVAANLDFVGIVLATRRKTSSAMTENTTLSAADGSRSRRIRRRMKTTIC